MPNLVLRLTDEDDADNARAAAPLSEDEALALLNDSEITAAQLVPWGSNYTFGVALTMPSGREHLGIYKPRAGEAPLWDFPEGTLYKREYAAYLLSRRLGWNLVPPTVVREGPHGIGSVQLYVEPDAERTAVQDFWLEPRPEIERLALFDHITNNADRKIGHCLLDRDGRIWGIDHGLTFNEDPKLRTVLWQFVGQPISEPLQRDLTELMDDSACLSDELSPWIARREITALRRRIERLLTRGAYPGPSGRRNVPYGWW